MTESLSMQTNFCETARKILYLSVGVATGIWKMLYLIEAWDIMGDEESDSV